MKRITNLLGVLTRQRPLPQVGATPADVVWTENKWRLLRYRSEKVTHATPVLLVPSLINRHYVLDLMPGKSFAEYLVQQGFEVFCIDWGTPGDEDRFLDFDTIVGTYLGRALKIAGKHAPKKQVHVLGYCMGGTLAVIHAAAHPERFASLTLLAAPISFDDDGLLTQWTKSKGFDVDVMIDALGTVPWQLLQSAFQMLRPTLPLSKAVMVLDRAWNDEFLDGFLALETWGNDNVALPGEFYRRYLQGLYRTDGLVKGEFVLQGRPVHLQNLTCPINVVSFEHDNIVLPRSAQSILPLAGSRVKETLHLPGGHVGAVVSKHAAKTLWPQLTQFFFRHDAVRVRQVS
jgi:polyhydroxyalkanoate synthase subunit PhaC